MTREIKLRFWDIDFKKWVKDQWVPWTLFTLENNTYCFDDKLVIPSQYTGFKDSEDKEIYEGDIVEIQLPPSSADSHGDISEVIFINGEFALRYMAFYYQSPRLEHSSLYSMILQFHLRVIGNIFENPELKEKLDTSKKIS